MKKQGYHFVAAIRYQRGEDYCLCKAVTEKDALEIAQAWIKGRQRNDPFGLNEILLRD